MKNTNDEFDILIKLDKKNSFTQRSLENELGCRLGK